MPFEDVAAETAVLAGILRHGRDAFIDADDLIDPGHMTDDVNQTIYSCIKDHYVAGEDRPLDFPTLMSIASRRGFGGALEREDGQRHVRGLFNFPVELSTVRPEAGKIRKLAVARDLDEVLRASRKSLQSLSGEESIDLILSLAENPIAEFASTIGGAQSDGPAQVAVGTREWLQHLVENPRENVGIPSPFAEYNRQIGGGFRPSTVTLIGARMKTGKSILAVVIGRFVASLGIPVLHLDTEMSVDEYRGRLMANATGIPTETIEKGMFDYAQLNNLNNAIDDLEKTPYFYESVIGKSFEEHLSTMRRWVSRHAPEDEKGNRPPTLIIYDYLQAPDASDYKSNLAEHQMLGFSMMSLLRVAAKFRVSMLSFIQLNRTGEEVESTSVVSGSDRPAMKCSSLSLFKKKSEAEIADDGQDAGNRKLVVVAARHGPGSNGNYINMQVDAECARITECKTKNEIRSERGDKPSDERTFEDRPKRKSRRKSNGDDGGDNANGDGDRLDPPFDLVLPHEVL